MNLERFADGHLTAITTDGSRVSLRLEAYVEYRLVPGEVSVVEVFELSADPAELAMSEPPVAEHCIEEPTWWDHDGRRTIEFFAPLRIQVTAAAFELTSLGVEPRPVLPAPSANVCTFGIAEIPPLGPGVVWRTLGGDAGTPADPDGWFLQRRDRLATSTTGVFCTTHADRVTFERQDADDALWRDVRLLGRHATRVWSGNCVFEPADWVTWVTTGVLPPVERLSV
ncbi:hypothetical protein SAMN05421837_105855 [Amycolatopsis pretoriensis]|uniref:Uncharacterized protein n=1 Tax=Amycolatopsis pretoriensis TaxID=218821 RepID=A0A1H5QZR8_9PSEU|nr:hypothetical protein [Amycolatopsis pretoriensis]SEF31646.1 hypothetical protein SAMN05421837_105855 [Amycolatopsis pretoriensis]